LLLHAEKLAALNIPIAVLPITVVVMFGESARFDAIVESYVAKEHAERYNVENLPSTPQPDVNQYDKID
jgi:hypothetical protein